MELIYYPGLNCHVSSLINIANIFKLNHLDAYSTLWGEFNFFDNADYKIFSSFRVLRNLKEIGLNIKKIKPVKSCNKISSPQILNGDFLVVGMDGFYIPWHPTFNFFHTEHFFFAMKTNDNLAVCFDPVYDKSDIEIKLDHIFFNAFEIFTVKKNEEKLLKNNKKPQKNGDFLQKKRLKMVATEILQTHKPIKNFLLAKILNCKTNISQTNFLLKQITAMINNRYLFSHFLFENKWMGLDFKNMFDADFFKKWEAIKNGLIVARILKSADSTLNEVYYMLENILNEEKAIARKILIKLRI